MTPEEFQNYCAEDQKLIMLEMCDLYNIVANYPVNIEELKIFAEWHRLIGKWGDRLEDFLIGIYPFQALEDLKENFNKEGFNRVIKLSDEALNFVTFWNRIVHQQY